MKKLGLVIILSLWLGACQQAILVPEKQTERSEQNQATTSKVTLVINDGEKVASYSSELAGSLTVLELLSKESSSQGWELKLKEYAFGTLVEAIGSKTNTANKAWIYYVNGKAGEVGAGEKTLMPGDVVEWKYEKPIY